MQNCCILGCDSYKYSSTQSITYFKFPIHDEILLRKWLNQIGRPSWHPTHCSEICSIHFSPSDIDNHPNRKYPALKPSAVPKIFPKKLSHPPKQHREGVSILKKNHVAPVSQNHVNREINVAQSVMQTSLVAPTIIHQLPAIDHSLSVPYLSSRFRKILPKLDPSVKIDQIQDSLASLPKTDTLSPIPIIIFPRLNTEKLHVPSNTRLPNLNKRKPILRITVTKKYHSEELQKSVEVDQRLSELDVRRSPLGEKESDATEEFEVKNYKLNRCVVFSLNPETGEISVTKRQIDCSKVAGENVSADVNKTIVNEVENVLSHERTEELKALCSRAEHDCNLLTQRLDVLRERQKHELVEIKRLQNDLLLLGGDSPSSSSQSEAHGEKRTLSPVELLESSKKVKMDINNLGQCGVINGKIESVTTFLSTMSSQDFDLPSKETNQSYKKNRNYF